MTLAVLTRRTGLRALVLYRAAMQWLWAPVGHALVWTLSRTGEGLTVLWAAATHGGVRALVLYRTGMHWLWSNAGRVIARASVVIGAALTVVGAAIARAGAWSLVHSARGIKRVWLTTVGRGDEPTPKPIRRWYTATFDAAFGIPPDGASVDVFGGRAASHMPTARSALAARATARRRGRQPVRCQSAGPDPVHDPRHQEQGRTAMPKYLSQEWLDEARSSPRTSLTARAPAPGCSTW
jgi:hypothetical protein